MLQAENDPKRLQRTDSDSFTDCEDITPSQIIPALLEKKVNVDDDVTDYEFAIMNANKPPQGELFQDETAKQVINLDDYKKDEQPFEVMPDDNVASEDLLIQIKEVERVLPNNIKHVKNTFDEVVSPFIIALQSSIMERSKREKSNASLVASYADDEVLPCSADGNVKHEKDESENTFRRIDEPSQENMDILCGNDATLTINVIDLSDEESTPKKSKRFTFTDSDLPDSDEIRDILMSYPIPTVVESFSESESENCWEDESYTYLRRRRNKTKPVTEIDPEKLPDRVMTRLRKLKPSYLTKQEGEMNEEIILENIKRLKSFKKSKTYKASKNHENIKEKKETTARKKTEKNKKRKRKVKVKIGKPERKEKKTKSFARKNSKEDSLELNSISPARRTRSMKKENDGKNTKNKCIIPRNKNKKPDHKRKPYMKERSVAPESEVRRSKRHQKAKEKNDDKMKPPISILTKSIQKQSTVYNISSSSSESPKSLTRSLVDDSDLTSPKRTRSHNNNNNCINNGSLRAAPMRFIRTQYVHLYAFPSKKQKQDKIDSYVHLVRYKPANSKRNFLTRSQLARRRFHRACKRTSREPARTLTKRL